MSSLYLDIGNSSVKMVAKKAGRWGVAEKIPHADMEILSQRINRDYREFDVLCCSVRKDLAGVLEKHLETEVFTLLTVPMVPRQLLNYHSPETLGMDRYLACFGAAMSAGSGVIVIDGGTACTVDFMSGEGVFHGGAILPGLTVTEHHFKQSLPELPLPQSEIPSQWPGKTTRECIQWGLYGGFRAAIQQFIDLTLNSSHEPLKLFVSGGDAERIANMLGNDHPLIVDQHLLFKGMELFHKKRSDKQLPI